MAISKIEPQIYSSKQPRIRISEYITDPDKGIETREKLIDALQRAAILEFSTIPPYLCALYSIKDVTTQAFQTLRSVVLEEMLHLNLVSNLVNSIGGFPVFVVGGNALVPSYPGYIFNQDPPSGPYVQLMAASTDLMQQVFMEIEKPAPYNAPAQEDDFVTIGQFYKAIEQGFENCVATEPDLFTKYGPGFQRTDLYFGSGGGKAIYVDSLDTAKLAIKEIVQQGEGATPPKQEYQDKQPFGTYNYYGYRSDDTYGPILGTPLDLSHYFKFKDLADGKIPLGTVYPMIPNPSLDEFESRWTRQLAELFNDAYGLMINTLQILFSCQSEPDPFYTIIVPLMQGVFTTLSTQLMQLPVLENGDSSLGANAGPCFQYSSITVEDFLVKTSMLKTELDQAVTEDIGLKSILATVTKLQNILQDINYKIDNQSLKVNLANL